MRLVMPKLYVILDAERMRGPAQEIAGQLMEAGVRLLQYRAKNLAAREMLETSTLLAKLAHGARATFFVNDRPDVAYLAGADGVHVGQDDLNVEQARTILGQERWVGVSTHSLEQFEKAAASSADYIAIGPIFATTSKVNPDPTVGLDLVRRARALTRKPIVAIGGIRVANAAQVLEAGADSVAVIGDILDAAEPSRQAKTFIERLEAVKLAADH